MSQALLAARRRGPWRISGVEIPEGARLALLLASANRDEKAFEAPDAFDIRRSSANKTPRLQPRHPLLPRCPVRPAWSPASPSNFSRGGCPTRGYPRPTSGFEFDPNVSFRGPKGLWAGRKPGRAAGAR